MARSRTKAEPRRKKWYESTALQVLGIVVPLLIILALVVILDGRRERFRTAAKPTDESRVSAELSFFADRPEGEIGLSADTQGKQAASTGRPAPTPEELEAIELRIAKIETSEIFADLTLDEYYAAQNNPALSDAEREELGNRLAGRRVLWAGMVEKISPQENGSVEITIHSKRDAFQRAFLAFPRDQRNQLRVLRVEHGVEFTGVVSSVIGWPFLERCEVLRSWSLAADAGQEPAELPAPAASAPLETLLRNAKAGRD